MTIASPNIPDFHFTQEEWVKQDICPICKRIVKINRHNKDLCTHIYVHNKKVEKAAHDTIPKAN